MVKNFMIQNLINIQFLKQQERISLAVPLSFVEKAFTGRSDNNLFRYTFVHYPQNI